MPLLIVLLLPIFEIFFSLSLIHEFGFVNMFFLWMLTVVLGVGLLRTTGVRMTFALAQSVRAGKVPTLAALEALVLSLAGILFLLPGFGSDIVASLLCVGLLRRLFIRSILKKVKVVGTAGFGAAGFGMGGSSSEWRRSHHQEIGPDVIDVEAVEVEAVDVEAVDVEERDVTNSAVGDDDKRG